MKKLFTPILFACAALFCGQAAAQTIPQPLSNGYIRTNLNPVRFLVTAPSSIFGLKRATIADWGGQLATPLLNQPVVRGFDSLGAAPLTNPSAISGKVCLLFRGGGISFAQKAQYAIAAGAIGVVIVNNIAGDPIAMGNTGTTTYTQPIVMVSNIDGIAMNNALINAPNSVTISLGKWSLATHDLGLLPAFQSAPHAMSIPYSQLSVGANRLQYRNFVGGAVGNFGTSAETGITVTDTVTWMPTSGSSSVVHTGSYTVPNMSSSDSVKFGFGDNTSPWQLTAPTSTGAYSYKYTLKAANTDDVPQDNVVTNTQYVTDSIFCKGNYNFALSQPFSSSGIQPSGISSGYSMGPLFYMAKGKYAARKIQYILSKNSVPTLDGEEGIALIFKWTDGLNGQPIDSFVEGDELTLVGINRKTFTTADSVGKTFTVNVLDPTVASKTVVLDSNAWYWVSVQSTGNCFVGIDNSRSYFTRSYIQSRLIKYNDMPELLLTDDYGSLGGSSTTLPPFPFGGNAYNIDSTFFDRFYYIPALALHISKNQIGAVPPTTGVSGGTAIAIGSVNVYPAPASNELNVNIKLNDRQDNVAIRLLDISGKVLNKIDLTNTQQQSLTIPCADIPSGIYYLAVFGDSGHIITKVVIKH